MLVERQHADHYENWKCASMIRPRGAEDREDVISPNEAATTRWSW